MYSKFVQPNLIWPDKWSIWVENVLWLAIIISSAIPLQGYMKLFEYLLVFTTQILKFHIYYNNKINFDDTMLFGI